MPPHFNITVKTLQVEKKEKDTGTLADTNEGDLEVNTEKILHQNAGKNQI